MLANTQHNMTKIRLFIRMDHSLIEFTAANPRVANMLVDSFRIGNVRYDCGRRK